MSEGDQSDLTLSYVSAFEYEYVIPRSTINYSDDKTGFVFVVMEREKAFTEKPPL